MGRFIMIIFNFLHQMEVSDKSQAAQGVMKALPAGAFRLVPALCSVLVSFLVPTWTAGLGTPSTCEASSSQR